MVNDITFKDVDGTTDVTYAAISGSAGDSSPAVYRLVSDPAVPVHALPVFTIGSRWNGPKTARRVTTDFAYPIRDTVLTDKLTGKTPATMSVLVPIAQTQASMNQQTHHAAMLNASAVVKSALASGYAPRF